MSSRYFPFALVSLACLACSKAPEPIDYSHAADFTYTGTLEAKQPITFAAASPVAQRYSWNFGDGTASGSGQQPVHAFTTAGTFLVKLTAYTPGASIISTQQLTIAQADTLRSYFASIAGEYRLTRQYSYSANPGSSPSSSTTACDILVTPVRDGSSLLLQQNGAPFYYFAGLSLKPPRSTPNYYTFSVSGAHYSYKQVLFKLASDSILVETVTNSSYGNTSRTRWWGKRR